VRYSNFWAKSVWEGKTRNIAIAITILHIFAPFQTERTKVPTPVGETQYRADPLQPPANYPLFLCEEIRRIDMGHRFEMSCACVRLHCSRANPLAGLEWQDRKHKRAASKLERLAAFIVPERFRVDADPLSHVTAYA
jgi:hypothetical protein